MPKTDLLRQAIQDRPSQCLNMVLATEVKMRGEDSHGTGGGWVTASSANWSGQQFYHIQ